MNHFDTSIHGVLSMNRRSFFSGLSAAIGALAIWRPSAGAIAACHVGGELPAVIDSNGLTTDPHSGYKRKNSVYWNGKRVDSPLLTEETLVCCYGNGDGRGFVEMVIYTPQEVIHRKRFTMPIGYVAVCELRPDENGEGMYFTTQPDDRISPTSK